MQYPIVEGIMRLWKLSFFFELLDYVPDHLGSLAILQPMLPMMEQLQDPLTCLFHLGVAVLRCRLHIRKLLFEGFRLLYHDLQAINHTSICDHGGDDGLKARWSSLDVIIRLVDAKDVGAAFVMRQCPVKADDLTPSAAMVRRYGGAMTLDQCLRVPSRLKDGRVHGATARGIAIPHLQLVDALQRLVRTEDKTGDRATDVLKTFLATKDVAKPCQPFGNRLWNPGNWQHVSLPPVCPDSRPSRGASLQRSNLTALSSSLPPFLAITFQVVCTTCCSAPRPTRSSPLPQTPTMSGGSSACSASSTPGLGPSSIIPMSIVWCQPVGSPPTGPSGGPPARPTWYPSMPSRSCFADCFPIWCVKSAPT